MQFALGHSFSTRDSRDFCSVDCMKELSGESDSEAKPILYRRHDTYCFFRKVEHIEKFLAYLNGQHLSTKFTYDIEEENSLPFLDVLVTWDGSAFFCYTS